MSFFYFPPLKGQQIELLAESGAIMSGDDPSSNALLKQSNYRAATLRFSLPADSHKIYSKIYNFPSHGIGIYSATFNNPSIGDPLSIYFFLKTPVIRKKRWNAFLEIAAGVAGNFNPYHKIHNPDNKLIGSNINMVGHLAIGVECDISKRFSLGTSAGYRHFSNGFIKAPNFGINLIPVTLNANFKLSKNNTDNLRGNIQPFQPHNQVSIFYAPGSKNFSTEEKNYFVSTLGILFIRQINYKAGIGAGLDLFYKSSGKEKVNGEGNDLSKTVSSGVYASIEWVLTEKFRINTGVGLYLFRHPENDEPYPLYERISARYTINKNLFAGIGIKINGSSSDYIEWTLGYTFKRDKNTYN